jgi:hypothetical protein
MTEESKIGLTKDEMLSQIEKDIEQQKKNMDYMVSLKGRLSSIVGASTIVTSNDLAEFHAKLAGDSALNVKAPDTGLTKDEMLNYIEKGVEQQKNNIDFLVARKEELSNDDPSCPANAEVDSFLFYSHVTLTTAPSQATKGYGNAGGVGVGTCVANGTLQGDLTHLNRASRFEVTEIGVGLGYLRLQFLDDRSWTVAVYNGRVGTDASAFQGGGSWSFVHV